MADSYVDMELDDDQASDMITAYPGMSNRGPQYPYGLRGCLDEKTLEKQGLEHKDFIVGGIMHIHAFAKITSVSEDPSGDGRVEFQITHLKVESEDAEDDAEEMQEHA